MKVPNWKFDPTMIKSEGTTWDSYLRDKLAKFDVENAIKDIAKSILWPVKCPVCGQETGNLRFHAMHEPDADHAVLAVHMS